MKHLGQVWQDKFVCNILNYKKNGFFVEFGSCDPIKNNNTYVLEKELGWTGLMFDMNAHQFLESYKEHRPNSKYFFGDAVSHDHQALFAENKVPPSVDYLQIDLHAPASLRLLRVLSSNILDSYKFGVVTYEHDIYQTKNPMKRDESRKIFDKHGYYLVFGDIHGVGAGYVFEDWYVHPHLVDMNSVKELQEKNKCNYVPNPLTQTSVGGRNIKY